MTTADPAADRPAGEGERKRCPRCGEHFLCLHHSDRRCACCDITLSPAVTELLRQRYHDCLCVRCLTQLRAAGD